MGFRPVERSNRSRVNYGLGPTVNPYVSLSALLLEDDYERGYLLMEDGNKLLLEGN